MLGASLDELTFPEAEQASGGAILAVPVGATEQHGPHLPLTTDSDIAVALVARLVARRPKVVAAPVLPFGSSGEHAAFAGTLSIGQGATEQVLIELGRSATLTFPRVLFVSTHGGNAEPVDRAVGRLRHEGRDARAWAPSWDGDAHAGEVETSLMLTLAPDRVRTAQFEAGETSPVADLLPRLRANGLRAVTANGVLGDPRGASAERGDRLLASAIASLVDLVDQWPAR